MLNFKIINRLFFITLLFFFVGCTSSKKIKDGNQAFELKKYALAAELLKKDYDKATKEDQKKQIAQKIADSYEKFADYEMAAQWFAKTIDDDNKVDYGYALMRAEQYEEALKIFEEVIVENRGMTRILEIPMQNCKKAISKEDVIETKAINSLNTPNSDYGLAVLGNEYYYSTAATTNNSFNLDEWINEERHAIFKGNISTDESFSTPTYWDGKINSPFHEATVSFTAKKEEAYFTRCGTENPKIRKEVCAIYHTYFFDGEWSTPEQITFFSDTVNNGHPFVTPDGKTLFFSSDYKDGFGGKDIYMTTKRDGEWDYPINVGSRINTEGDEMFPYFDIKNLTLYFASNGFREGFGGLDIYKSEKVGKIFKNTQNLGFGINTGADDFSFLPIKSKDDSVEVQGYLSSNRKGGKGKDDIYFISKRIPRVKPLPPAVFIARISILEKTSKEDSVLQGAIINMDEKVSRDLIPYTRLTSDAFGKAETEILKNTEFILTIGKENYFTQVIPLSSVNLLSNDGDTIYIDKIIYLEKIVRDVEFTINNIYYDLDKWDIRDDAMPVLDSLSVILINNPGISVELGSHTDSRGKDDYNLKLSQRRAQSAVDYLINKGVAAERLEAKGYGETRIVNQCSNNIVCSEEEHQKNRRTTFKIISIR